MESGYQAIVARAYTRPHPNADRIQLADVLGEQVIVGLNVEDGALGVYFPAGGQLSEAFCEANDLYPTFDEDGRRTGGGFIDPKRRRVRAQSFRGERSYGLWIPLSSLSFTGISPDDVTEGMTFTAVGEYAICQRYVTQMTKEQAQQRQVNHRREFAGFLMHHDTAKLARNADQITQGMTLFISEKLHGTSHRVGKPLVEKRPSGWRAKLIEWLGGKGLRWLDWPTTHGSRRVVISDNDGGYYGNHAFRYDATPWELSLRPGETVYGEIVGWASEQKPIMPTVKVGLKHLKKQYGELMTFTYGQMPGTRTFYAYRITQTYADGRTHELCYSEMVTRCAELGIEMPPLLQTVSLHEDGVAIITTLPGQQTELEMLDEVPDPISGFVLTLAERLVDGPSFIDERHLREGVCVRVERNPRVRGGLGEYITTYKHKSHDFLMIEEEARDQGLEDVEEQEAVLNGEQSMVGG